MKDLIRPFPDSYANLLKTTKEALAQFTVQDDEQEPVTKDGENNEGISADVNEENEISEKNLEAKERNKDAKQCRKRISTKNTAGSGEKKTKIPRVGSSDSDFEFQQNERRLRQPLSSMDKGTNQNIIAEHSDVEVIGTAGPVQVSEANFSLKCRQRRVQQICEFVEQHKETVKELFRLRLGKIQLFKEYAEQKKLFEQLPQDWQRFCKVVEVSETIGLLVKIFQYISFVLAQFDSNSQLSIRELVKEIRANIFDNFELHSKLSKMRLLELFKSHKNVIQPLMNALSQSSSNAEAQMKSFEKRQVDSTFSPNYLLERLVDPFQ